MTEQTEDRDVAVEESQNANPPPALDGNPADDLAVSVEAGMDAWRSPVGAEAQNGLALVMICSTECRFFAIV